MDVILMRDMLKSDNLYTANIYELADVKAELKLMMCGTRLPIRNSLEENLMIRSALDQMDVSM